ncbi:hypothetical protein BU24DRAFT_456185 [Aaosphaeria arxii CBS 175.79]|uniref:SET domain-containing protein n=1 Tax=Aaosphaeria arxii CBS 175.79 TaxID=1450172 RepID=A0A6A5X6T3_9PLEO|nr:uncharacterized protein BU24DRAFT_456185 [Aaosphaeria arxii CBS 175.79]KAF2008673.1 hypothetical protein BU24DRAFT_456185 [Aaosphaeria arxii CBS 175.79]
MAPVRPLPLPPSPVNFALETDQSSNREGFCLRSDQAKQKPKSSQRNLRRRRGGRKKKMKAPDTMSSDDELDLFALLEYPLAGCRGDQFRGLYATTDIKKGTRVIDEVPLFTLPEPGDVMEHVLDAFFGLSDEQKDMFMELPPGWPPMLVNMVHFIDPQLKVMEDLIAKGDEISEYEEEILIRLGNTVEPLMIEWRIGARYFTHRFSLVHNSIDPTIDEPGDDQVTGIFPTAARLRHSCIPNCNGFYDTKTKRFRVQAVRDIAAHEELCMSVLGSQIWYHNADARADLLRQYCDQCNCIACDPAHLHRTSQDVTRSDIHNRVLPIQDFLQSLHSTSGYKFYNFAEAEASILELIRLLKVAGCADAELIRWRLALILEIYPCMKGKWIQCLAQAQQALETAVACLGADHHYVSFLESKIVYIKQRAKFDRQRRR